MTSLILRFESPWEGSEKVPPENYAAEKDAISKVATAWLAQDFLGIDVVGRLRRRSARKMIWSSVHKDRAEKIAGAKAQVSDRSLPC
jgi:hypothetical protein